MSAIPPLQVDKINKNISLKTQSANEKRMGVQKIEAGSARTRGFVLLVILLLTTIIVSAKSVTAQTEIRIPTIADAYVDNATPNANYGNSLFLYTHYYNQSVGQASAGSASQNEVGPIVRTWLKFDLSQIPSQAEIDSAILRVHTAIWGTRSVNKVSVYVCDDTSWTESSISWNNAPSAVSSHSLGTIDCRNPDVDYNFDLSSALSGGKSISLVLETVQLSKEPAVFNSRDLNPDTGPTLIVDYSLPLNVEVIGLIVLAVIIALIAIVVFLRLKKQNSKS